MVDNTIALQARAPRILSYGELVAGRDQEMSRRNALAMQQQQMQQNAMAQQKARATESAMAGAASLANAGEFDAAEKQYGLGAGNLEVHAALSKLSDEHRALVRSRFAAAAPIAIQALQEPDMGKRAALVQAAAPMLVQNGWKPEEIAQFQPTDQALSGIINNARTAEDALKLYDKQNELRVLSRGAGLFRGGEKIAEMPIEEKGHITRAADGTIVSIVGNVATPVTMANGPTKHFGPVIEQAVLQLNPGTVVSGRGRTPERNAQVGGVANSYHLSDDARDLQPARGQTLDQLAASLAPLKQQGFDVIIERGKNHVHVEPGAGMGRANVGAPLRGYEKPTGATKPAADKSALPPQQMKAMSNELQQAYDLINNPANSAAFQSAKNSWLQNQTQSLAHGKFDPNTAEFGVHTALPGGVEHKSAWDRLTKHLIAAMYQTIKPGQAGMNRAVASQKMHVQMMGGGDNPSRETLLEAIRSTAADYGITLRDTSSAGGQRQPAHEAVDNNNPLLRGH